MNQYEPERISEAAHFVSALFDLCNNHGFHIDSHSPMFVYDDRDENDLSRLFEVRWDDELTYFISEPIR